VEELPLILLACRGHGTSNIFCSSETPQLVVCVCAFLQSLLLVVGLSRGESSSTGTEVGEPAAGMVHRRDRRQDTAVELVKVLVPL
jgi:hypothetical protein